MKSTPPASLIPDSSGPHRRAHARFLAALLCAAALAVAVWLALNTGEDVYGATRTQLFLALASIALLLIGITFYLAASMATARSISSDLEVDRAARTIRRIRSLSGFGAVFAIAAVMAIAGLGALRILAPPAERPVSVQFSEVTGRVQLEYCPSLPSSFEALAKPTDLASSSTLLPVWVASRVCGNPSFQHGVWLYLNRSTITVADAGDR
ncbi:MULTISPECIES: hypothetical protein [unclassified Cryobacterium]|uniref:hypothetical protein n=1 Tax=unclassified Cryobacterium TaxID=2649013 RepID=UPI00106D7661|nr:MULTISPECIES: hypothetical protein [unclassified Cryobacterium]TFD03596.1 hypothetical protein E3T29_17375 [Cryobacterium sp. TMT1-66-1]TFD12901.1 hypothetical protein E3T35_06330 [Cryobacterium sp. TMT1-2-2]